MFNGTPANEDWATAGSPLSSSKTSWKRKPTHEWPSTGTVRFRDTASLDAEVFGRNQDFFNQARNQHHGPCGH